MVACLAILFPFSVKYVTYDLYQITCEIKKDLKINKLNHSSEDISFSTINSNVSEMKHLLASKQQIEAKKRNENFSASFLSMLI